MSSKRRIRRNQCGNKVRHPTEAGARVAINKLIKAYQGAIGYLNAYRCQHCGAWHVGHAKRKGPH